MRITYSPARLLTTSIAQLATLVLLLATTLPAQAEKAPPLPDRDGKVNISAQSWPHKPGPRSVAVSIHYPDGTRKSVGKQTGLMLTLHNWGGADCVGTADPRTLARRYNVVALCVNYLQSGPQASIRDPEPYDFGYLQALDALRALYYVFDSLSADKTPFDAGRIYVTGGSGGGNVSLMANKLAPRTFACLIDLSGMARLSDDIAFNLPGGSGLNARFSREPAHPFYLTPDRQQLHFIGDPAHLAVMKRLGSTCKLLVVHGAGDRTCPIEDARQMVANMQKSGLDVEPHIIEKTDLDGKVFLNIGHGLGNRTKIVTHLADKYLLPDSPQALRRGGPTDFERRDGKVVYPTAGGRFVISYKNGYPVGSFEPKEKTPAYRDHLDLTYYLDADGKRQPIHTTEDWLIRRRHVLENMQLVMGKLPGKLCRVPLDVKVLEEVRIDDLVRRKVSYQSDANDRVHAYLFLPPGKDKKPAVLCLQQTTKVGKDEPAGLGGNPDLHYALHLARRGYVTLAPDYPSFGEHKFDFALQRGYLSGTMKAIWDNVRAVDLLESLDTVDPERIGCIGHSLGGHSAMFTAAFEPRIRAIVSSCGFSRFATDDVPSWTGPRYMPRIATVYNNDAKRVPFDFPEIVASFAPRAFFASAATRDRDFDVKGVRQSIDAASNIYRLYGKEQHLQAFYPDAPHSFPEDARRRAYAFLDQHLKP